MPKLVNTKLILTLILVIVVSGKRRSEDSKMRPTAAYSITLLYQTRPNTPDTLKKFTIDVINQKIKMTKRRITVNTLERLLKQNIGTNEVEHASRRLAWGGSPISEQEAERRRQQYVVREMQARRNYAIADWDRERRKYFRYYRRLSNMIDDDMSFQATTARDIKREIGVIMQEEIEVVWQTGCSRMKEKVSHLITK